LHAFEESLEESVAQVIAYRGEEAIIETGRRALKSWLYQSAETQRLLICLVVVVGFSPWLWLWGKPDDHRVMRDSRRSELP